jgi:beta-glucanase (GH16 family)
MHKNTAVGAMALSLVPLLGHAAAVPTCAPTYSENFSNGFGAFKTGRDWSSCPGGLSSDMTSYIVSQSCGPGTDPAANAYQTGANGLTLQVKPTPASVAGQVGGAPFIGSEATTQGTFAQTYGYFQVTGSLPQNAGLNPAFWLLPANLSRPPELDIMEMPTGNGGGGNTVFGTLHTGTLANQEGGSIRVNDPTAVHTYAVDWEPNTITWYVDGVPYSQVPTPADMHQPMYMLLDLFAGTASSWEGAPTPGETANYNIQSVQVFAANPYTGTSCAAPAALPPLNQPVTMAPPPIPQAVAPLPPAPDQIVPPPPPPPSLAVAPPPTLAEPPAPTLTAPPPSQFSAPPVVPDYSLPEEPYVRPNPPIDISIYGATEGDR